MQRASKTKVGKMRADALAASDELIKATGIVCQRHHLNVGKMLYTEVIIGTLQHLFSDKYKTTM